MKIYVASPLGFSEVGRFWMHEKLFPILTEKGITILDPWSLPDPNEINRVNAMPYGPEKRAAWQLLNPKLAFMNEQAIEQANGLFAVLDGVDIDSGTAAEIGYATALGKPLIGYRGDFRLSADNDGADINLQVEYFIRKHGGTVIRQLTDLPNALRTVFGV